VAEDQHIAINGGTNWYAPWYLDWHSKFDDIHTPDYPVPKLRGTVQSLLNPDVNLPGFEHAHHERMALAGESWARFAQQTAKVSKRDADSFKTDPQSWVSTTMAGTNERDALQRLSLPIRAAGKALVLE
jgi:hypothetical protein